MQIFLDSADEKELTHWLAEGVVDGVTTNPSILLKDGASDLETVARRLAALLGHRPLSVEVTATEPGQMIEQGRSFARWASNIVVKIPIVTQDGDSCLRAIYALSRAGIPVNATAIPVSYTHLIWPLVSYKQAVRLNNEVPGIVIPPAVLEELEAAGAAAR